MTTLTIEELTGTHIRLWPYFRGLYPRQTLHTLWSMVEAERATNNLFWGQTAPTDQLYSWRGDLVEFVKFFSGDVLRQLFVAQDAKGEELAGLFWFDDIVPDLRASANIFYRRKFWGPPAMEASRLAFRYGFEVMNLKAIWAFTPFKLAWRHAEHVGMSKIATLPEYGLMDGTPVDLAILRILREEFYG